MTVEFNIRVVKIANYCSAVFFSNIYHASLEHQWWYTKVYREETAQPRRRVIFSIPVNQNVD